MNLFKNINELLCLLVVTCCIIQGHAAVSGLFSDFDTVISDSKGWIANLYSKVKNSIPSSSFISLYYEKLNILSSITGSITNNFIGGFKTVFHNSEHFITHISKNNSLWQCWPFNSFHSNPNSAFNVTAFKFLINHELYGQHLVDLSITDVLETHIHQDNPPKPLIMSFHGSSGSGKSFVSKMIAESLYLNGYKSEYVHVYHGSLDFPHENQKEIYRARLLNEISVFSHISGRFLFIFDEMDKMVPGVIDVLLPLVVFNDESSKIDIRKSILIFISKIGAKKIEEICYDSWLDGISREDMTIDAFAAHLKETAYNAPSGLQHSELVKKNLIDVFVSFLPLEREHIKQCIVRELKLRQLPYNKSVVEKVADQFDYDPPQFPLFSSSGCKKVSNKVDLYGDDS